MAIIPGDMRIVWLSPAVDLTERRTNKVNSESEAYTMDDIVDTVSGEIPTGVDWGNIEGTLSDQIDLQSELDDKQDSLVSGTNIKTINGTTLLGSGDVETASVNPSSTFLPINESDAFADSPIFAEHSGGSEGFTLLETKVNGLNALPVGGIEASPSFGISAEFNPFLANQRVQLGDFANYQGTGKFEWSTGGNAPPNASYIKFDTYGYDHFESTFGYFKLNANTGNPANVDGLLYNPSLGIIGFGASLDANTQSSSGSSIVWDYFGGAFKMKGSFGDDCFFSNIAQSQTYMQSEDKKLGIELSSMYISSNLTNNNAIGSTEVTKLQVRDNLGNVYAIKLFPYI